MDEIVQDTPVVDIVADETPIDIQTTPQESPTSSYEDEAREQGWKPKEEYEGDPDKWRPAKEFVERGELFGKIDGMGKELKETKKALKMLQDHHSKVRETEYKRAVDELKSLQKRHLEEGNSDGYLEATELLTDLRAEQKARDVVREITPPPADPRFTAWVQKNNWYAQDSTMRDYADAIGMGYSQKNPGMDPEDVLQYVTSEVKERFKSRFTNPNRNKPSSVEGSSQAAPVKKSSFQLTDEERKVMHTFERTGIMSKEDYIAELKKMKGVE